MWAWGLGGLGAWGLVAWHLVDEKGVKADPWE
jgi:hypothetical protein